MSNSGEEKKEVPLSLFVKSVANAEKRAKREVRFKRNKYKKKRR